MISSEFYAGVSENRIQNIVITLDKIRLALRQPSQPEAPPLMLLAEEDVVEYLWQGIPTILFDRCFIQEDSMQPFSSCHILSSIAVYETMKKKLHSAEDFV